MWRVQYEAINSEDISPPYESYCVGNADIVIRPSPVPRGLAAMMSREAMAEVFARRIVEVLVLVPEPPMPGPIGWPVSAPA